MGGGRDGVKKKLFQWSRGGDGTAPQHDPFQSFRPTTKTIWRRRGGHDLYSKNNPSDDLSKTIHPAKNEKCPPTIWRLAIFPRTIFFMRTRFQCGASFCLKNHGGSKSASDDENIFEFAAKTPTSTSSCERNSPAAKTPWKEFAILEKIASVHTPRRSLLRARTIKRGDIGGCFAAIDGPGPHKVRTIATP